MAPRGPESMKKLYGIIGNSPEAPLFLAMHEAAFKTEKIEAEYTIFNLDLKDSEALANFCYESEFKGLGGFSVGAEQKGVVMDYLDHRDAIAERLEAVNTVKNEAYELNGFNTEVASMLQALQEQTKLPRKKVLILGAGELARALTYGLKEYGADVHIWNRSPEKAAQLEEEFDVESIEFRNIKEAQFDIIINATPIGKSPEVEQSLLMSDQIKEKAVVMETVIEPLETQLLKEAKKAGAKTVSAERILLHKAGNEFTAWFDRPAPFEVMEKALYEAIKNKDNIR